MAKKEFQAESRRLLELMINSIYTHQEIFLRELISNASDAIDKLCFRSLTDENVGMERGDFFIRIKGDKENGTLTISDNGIGMTAEEMESNLGVIAKSGSLAFKKDLDAAAVAQWEEVRRRMAGRLILKLGVEFGSPTYDHTAARRTLDQSLLDFVIGSLHNYSPEAGGADFYLGDYTSPEICYAALDDYFAHMARLAPLPFYDSLGHIIYPLRYMCMRDGQSVSLDRYMDAIREILKTVVETGHGIEVNTYNGRTVSDWRPILDLYREVGGEILTVGSDAHAPRNVARGIRDAYALIAEAGFRYVAVYARRKPAFIPL